MRIAYISLIFAIGTIEEYFRVGGKYQENDEYYIIFIIVTIFELIFMFYYYFQIITINKLNLFHYKNIIF